MASKAYELAILARDASTLTGNAQAMGDANTLDGHDSSYFAVATHDHDSWYLKFDGGVLTGYVTVHATPTSDMHVANKKYVDDQVSINFSSLSSSKSDATHDHDLLYSDINHNHASEYAELAHQHDSRYLRLSGGEIVGSVIVQEPVLTTHPTTKNYVDDIISSHSHSYASDTHTHSEFALSTTLAQYSELEYVNEQLALKLDTASYTTQLDDYALKTYVDTAVSDKTTQSYVDTNLGLKADNATMQVELATKANSAVVSQLATELDALEASAISVLQLNTALGAYVENTTYAVGLAAKADQTVVSALATDKADVTYVDTKISDLVGTSPQALNTLQEISTALQNEPDIISNLYSSIGYKADRDYVDDQIAVHAHGTVLYNEISGTPTIPTLLSQLLDDIGVSSLQVEEFGPYDSDYLKTANGDGSDNHIGFITTIDTSKNVQVFLNGIKLVGPIIQNSTINLDARWERVQYDYIGYKDTNDIVFESHLNMTADTILEIVVISEP
jgi:hypothetical protein